MNWLKELIYVTRHKMSPEDKTMNSQDTFKFAETHEWADQEDDGA
jgi:hypothetical protein